MGLSVFYQTKLEFFFKIFCELEKKYAFFKKGHLKKITAYV